MKHRWQLIVLPVLALLLALSASASQAQEPVAGAGSEPLGGPPLTDMFTYQGYLTDAGAPANGYYDFDVTIWSAETGGTQVGNCTTAALSNVLVQNGVFTFDLYPDTDINTVFNGAGRWLQVKVRRHGTTTWTTLPRQPITTVPYAFGLRPGAKLEAQYAGTLFSLKNTYTAGSTAGSAIRAESTAPTVPTIAGQHNGDGPAIYGYTEGAYPAVEGMHGGAGSAVAGFVSNAAATGVLGVNTSNGGSGVKGTSEGGIGVEGRGGTISYAGVLGSGASYGGHFTANVGYGIYATGPMGAADFNGDVKQSRASDGLVKAAVYAMCSTSASIYRSFNNVGGTITIANGASAGHCTIDFGFKINDRFFTAIGMGSDTARGVSCYWGSTDTKLDCFRWDASGAGTNGQIMVVIY